MIPYKFVILHKVLPYTRTTQMQKWVDPRYQRYAASQNELRRGFTTTMAEQKWPMLERKPIEVAILIQLEKLDHRVDLDNQVKAIIDAAQKVVFPFDGWVDSIYARREQFAEDRLWMWVGYKPKGLWADTVATEIL